MMTDTKAAALVIAIAVALALFVGFAVGALTTAIKQPEVQFRARCAAMRGEVFMRRDHALVCIDSPRQIDILLP